MPRDTLKLAGASALDMLIQAQMVDLLRELQRRRDLTYMFISHDLRVVASLASHLIVMRGGKVVEEGQAAELFKNPKTDYTRARCSRRHSGWRRPATGRRRRRSGHFERAPGTLLQAAHYWR